MLRPVWIYPLTKRIDRSRIGAGIAVACTEERGCTMGDKGKKDKEKGQKQNLEKQQLKKKQKEDKQPKRSS